MQHSRGEASAKEKRRVVKTYSEDLTVDAIGWLSRKTRSISIRFVRKIVRFFYMIFGVNKVFACGVSHY
ncbi:MAG: hypothetical protein PUF31_04500 [Oscillospiraceae bacterium]|nr:hypothetical protein [Oscillospiraceae bacterium]